MEKTANLASASKEHLKLARHGDELTVEKVQDKDALSNFTDAEVRNLLVKKGVREREIKIDKLDVFYIEAGDSSKETLLLIHGGGNSSSYRAWKHNILELSKHYHVVAPDLPGYGLSTKPKERCTLDYYTKNFIGKFIDSVGLEKPNLVGSSLGGAVALGFALDNKERVSSLILIDSYGLYSTPFSIPIRILVMMPDLSKKLLEYIKHNKKIVGKVLNSVAGKLNPRTGKKEVSDDVVEGVISYLGKEDTMSVAFIEFLADQMSSSPKKLTKDIIDKIRHKNVPVGLKTNFTSRLPEFENSKVNVLFIHGDNDPLFPLSSAREAARVLPSCKLIEVKDCGHGPHIEKPEEFNKYVLDFLSANNTGDSDQQNKSVFKKAIGKVMGQLKR